MEKQFILKVEIKANNTSQTFEFSKDISSIEQLAIWVLVRELADKQIRNILK